MNQAVFEKFLVGSDGSTEALPTDEFGVLLRPDFVLVNAARRRACSDRRNRCAPKR